MRLQDKVVTITGATKGIGSGIASILAREGAAVVLSGRDTEAGHAQVQDIRDQGGRAFFVPADASKVSDCNELIDATLRQYGRIDGLVNNAGIFPNVPLLEMDEATFDQVMAINAKGAFFTTQRALRYMTEQRSGSIVNIGSTHWALGGDLLSAYAMSKGALHTLTQHVAHHFAPYKIRCNWITVGWVLTPGESARVQKAGHDQAWIETLAAQLVPMGTLQRIEDIAYACLYLLGDESTQVTATDIKPNGGFHVP